jgi:hypothetical protein
MVVESFTGSTACYDLTLHESDDSWGRRPSPGTEGAKGLLKEGGVISPFPHPSKRGPRGEVCVQNLNGTLSCTFKLLPGFIA